MSRVLHAVERGHVYCSSHRVRHIAFARVAQQRLAASHLLAFGLAGAGVALTPQPALACGASPSPTYTITAVSPTEGSAGVPRDVGIIVSGTASDGPAGWSLPVHVDVIDVESGEAVAVNEVSWFSPDGAEVTTAVHPTQPLAAQRRYRVEAALRSDAVPRDAFGNEEPSAPLVSSFVTSGELLEPLLLSGGIELSLRSGEVDAISYGVCGQTTVTGKRRALVADVRLPAPSGGQGFFRGELVFSDNTPVRIGAADPSGAVPNDADPHDTKLTRSLHIVDSEVLTLTQEIFPENFDYAGCFSLAIWDPAGHVAQTSACLPTLSADEINVLAGSDESIQLAQDEATASNQVDQAVADARSRDLGCALGASGSNHTPGWLALLFAAGLVRRGRGRG